MAEPEEPVSVRSLESLRAVSEDALGEAPPADAGDVIDSERPTSGAFDGEDFLYHLYRGSELLQDNCVGEAKEELERALALQPRDVEGQGLLGVVYFRLGLYPRAIQIYEDICRAVPSEITPRVNLGLCYLKTGQYPRARECLEEVIRLVPDHRRAWGYLGLVYERSDSPEKALEAFRRAGQQSLARRMERALEAEDDAAPAPDPQRDAVRRAAADAIQELDDELRPFERVEGATAEPRFGRWHAREPGEEHVPPPASRRPATRSVPPPPPAAEPAAVAAEITTTRSPADLVAALVAWRDGSDVALHDRRLADIRVDGGFAVRLDWVRALCPAEGRFEALRLNRRARGQDLDEPLGGLRAPLMLLEGRGQLLLACPPEARLFAVRLAREFFYVREDRLVGFDAKLRHESGRLATGAVEHVPMLQLSGDGALVLRGTDVLHAVEVSPDRAIVVRGEDVVAWTGRLIPQPLKPDEAPAAAAGFVKINGDGAVLLDPE